MHKQNSTLCIVQGWENASAYELRQAHLLPRAHLCCPTSTHNGHGLAFFLNHTTIIWSKFSATPFHVVNLIHDIIQLRFSVNRPMLPRPHYSGRRVHRPQTPILLYLFVLYPDDTPPHTQLPSNHIHFAKVEFVTLQRDQPYAALGSYRYRTQWVGPYETLSLCLPTGLWAMTCFFRIRRLRCCKGVVIPF